MIFRERPALSWQERLRVWIWPRHGWKRVLQHVWKRVRRLRDTPHAIATGFTVGFIVSFTPLLGLHVVLACLLAWILRGNIIATLLGTLAGNPITFPFIWALIYQVGIRVSGSESSEPIDSEAFPNVDTLLDVPSWGVADIFWTMLIGSVPVCLLLAVVLYPTTHLSISLYQMELRNRRARRRHAAMRDNLPAEAEKP